MRFNLIDVLFMDACIIIGMIVGALLSSHRHGPPRLVAMGLGAVCMYLAVVYPFYRGFRRYPMLLPRCPCCRRRDQKGFHVCGNRPRIIFRCPLCDGEFVVWHNGKPGDEETWEKPVLALNRPYALGIYNRVKKPETDAAPNAGSADAPPASPS
jgi:hypothetical protein